MDQNERIILFIREYLYNREEFLKSDLDNAIYEICQRKKWNRQNFDSVIEKYYLYRAFKILYDEIIKILNF